MHAKHGVTLRASPPDGFFGSKAIDIDRLDSQEICNDVDTVVSSVTFGEVQKAGAWKLWTCDTELMVSVRQLLAVSDDACGWRIGVVLLAFAAAQTRVAIPVVRTAQPAVQATWRNQSCFDLRLMTGRHSGGHFRFKMPNSTYTDPHSNSELACLSVYALKELFAK